MTGKGRVKWLVCLVLLFAFFGSEVPAHAECQNLQFTESARISIPSSGAEFLTSSDVNGDGAPDLIMKRSPNSVQVGLGDGTGRFNLHPTLIDSGDAHSAAIADLNRDGKADLVIGAINSVQIYQGIGDGTFALRTHVNLKGDVLTEPARHAVSLVLDDFNNDTSLDFAFPIFPTGVVRVMLTDSTGFVSSSQLTIGSVDLPPNALPYDIVSADFNKDGSRDLAVVNIHGGGTVEVLNRSGDASGFFHLASISGGGGFFSLVKGDFNEDGNVDLAIRDGDGHIVLIKGGVRNTSNELSLERWKDITPGIFAGYLAVADFNSDRHDDLLVSGFSGNLLPLLGDGSGNFSPGQTIGMSGWPTAMTVADFNRDGLLDFAVVNKANDYVSVFLNGCTAPTADLSISGIEVTQTIQDLGNTVPLVANKRTFVRVHIAGNIQAQRIAAQLVGQDSSTGQTLGRALIPSNIRGLIDLKLEPDRGERDDSFYFELPVEWTRVNALKLTAEINTNRVVNEVDRANNTQSVVLPPFRPSKALNVRVVRYQNSLVNISDEGWDRDFAAIVNSLLTELPLPTINFSRATFVDDGEIGNIPGGLEISHLQGWRERFEPASGGTFYYAVGDFIGGVAKLGDLGTTSWYGVGNSIVVVHEFGHMLGLRHVNGIGSFCNHPSDVDVNYPYPDGKIGGPASEPDKFLGLHPGNPQPGVANLIAIISGSAWDTMTYCNPAWFSDWSIRKMLQYIEQNSNIARTDSPILLATADDSIGAYQLATAVTHKPSHAALPQIASYQEGDFLTIYGAIDLDNQQLLSLSLSRDPMVGIVPERQPGPYRLQLWDASHNLLAEYLFSPSLLYDAPNIGVIALALPFVANTKTIVIFSDALDQELTSIAVSDSIPIVRDVIVSRQLTDEGRELLTLSWEAIDADGDSLTYTVLYSADGKNAWQAMAMDLRDNRLTLDTIVLKGTTSEASGYFRVIANDGVLTGWAESLGVNIENKPPSVTLLSPQDKATYIPGQLVALQALADDLEDEAFPDDAYLWTSDRDGALGTGPLVHVSQLSSGLHLVTVVVTDARGKSTAQRISIDVESSEPPPDGSLLREYSGAIYVIYGGAKFHIPNMPEFDALELDLDNLKHVYDGALVAIPTIPRDDTVLQERSSELIYVIRDGKRWFADDYVLTQIAAGQVEVNIVPNGGLAPIPMSAIDGTLLREPSGAIYVIYGGARFHIPNMDIFNAFNFDAASISEVSNSDIASIPVIPSDGTLLREPSGAIYVIYGGARFHIPNMGEFNALNFDATHVRQLWDGALVAIPTIPRDDTVLQERSSELIYVIRDGKRWFADDYVLTQIAAGQVEVNIVPNGGLAPIPIGAQTLSRNSGLDVWHKAEAELFGLPL